MPKKLDPTTQYATDVINGRIIAGRMVRLACARHLQDLKHGKKRGLSFDVKTAQRVFDFFKTLRLTEGEHDGKPFLLQPFQKFIVGSLFGWKTKDGSRRFRTAYIESGKGSGKSPLAAGIGLYGLTADGESGAEIYSAAVSRDQAKILFRDAENMVLTSPDLREHVQRHVGNLSVPSTFSYFRPVSSEHRGLDGKRVHMALIDEVHVHPDALVVDKMRAGTKGRRQALIFLITNSGTDRNSVCWHYHELSRKVVSGEVDNDSFFAYVCQLDPCEKCLADGKTLPVDGCLQCDDWRDEETWIKANPCLGISITKRYLKEQVDEAIQMPSKENIVKRLNFCVWCVAFGTLISMADGSRKRAEELRSGDLIIAFDEKTGKLVNAVVTSAGQNETVPLYRIVTARGRIVNVSGNHRFWARYGRSDAPKYGWKRADELQRGSRIASALGSKVPRGSRRMNADEAYLLGVVVGDGTCRDVKITNTSPEIIESCNKVMRRHGCELVSYKNGGPWHYARHIVHSKKSTWLKRLLVKHGLKNKTECNKRVPQAVFKGGTRVWAAFLSGYLDTDGCILETKGNRIAQWISVNRELLSDCQHLLALLGIQSSVNAVRGCHRLEVRDPVSLAIMAKRFSLSHPKKKEKLEQFRKKTRKCYQDKRNFDLVKSVEILSEQPTIGIEVQGVHTHVTDGLISHNTEQTVRWMPMTAWDACSAEIPYSRLIGETCYAGLDLASRTDLCALVLLFPNIDGRAVALPFFWAPREGAERRQEVDHVPYMDWSKQGLLELTEGNATDYDVIRAKVRELNETFRIHELGFDPWNAQQLCTQLMDDGLTVVELRQNYANLSGPMKELESLVKTKALDHGNHPIMRWMASNVSATMDKVGNIKPGKERYIDKIDGIVALIMAIARWMVNKDPNSVYEERGVLML